MESPVMTSASSHRLRSAVSACAQPTHSYLNSSYLSTSIQVESHNSGGCLKKFYNSGKNGESSPSLNATKKSHTSTDYSPLHKRYKSCGKNGYNHHHHHHHHHHNHHRAKSDGKEVEASSNRGGVLNLIPKQFMIGNDFLSKLSLNRQYLDSNRLAEYRNESVSENCEKVINGKTGEKISKKGDGLRNGFKVLNHRQEGCNKVKSKKRTTTGKKDRINEENQESDECSKCGGAPEESTERNDVSKWDPKHVVTRTTAEIDRVFSNDCQSRVESTPPESVNRVESLQLFPSIPQDCTMLEKDSPGKPPDVTNYESDLYKYSNELTKSKEYTRELPKILEKNELEKRSRKFSKGMSKYEVFLGGSCNPTTWRTAFAIPELEKMGISYYNPQQVEEWRPELMEVEYHAKKNATVMFFVLDNQTRGISALIEVAHLAGNLRQLILVVQSYKQKNPVICNEEISNEEFEDLKTGQEVLQDLMERQKIPVFDNMKVALECTEKILRKNLTVQDLQEPVHVKRENPIGLRDVFDKLDVESSGKISISDSCLALKMLTGVKISVSDLKLLISNAGKDLNGTHLDDIKLDFEQFSELVAEFRRQLQDGTISDLPALVNSCCRDVYLGGTIENTSWRESIALPILEKENLTYFVPKINEGGKRFTEIEAAAMEHSFVLFFAITNTARSIAAMAIAGHYIGKGARVVLCVEHLPENATIGQDKLSENAVKDYNRGRMYLKDIAERSGVRVFTDISMAVKFVTEICRKR